jgi:hypothetical protein
MPNKLRSPTGKAKELGKKIPGFGPQRNGSTKNRDRRYDGDVRSVELSSPPARYVGRVNMRCAKAVTETRELYIGLSLYERHDYAC